MGEWQAARLGDVADILTGYPFRSDQYTSDNSGIRLIRGDNIVQGCLRWDGVKRWPASQATVHANYALAPNDVVLAMDRPWIEAGLKYATIREADCPSLLVQRVTRLRGTDRVDGRYLAYVIGSAAFTQHVLAVQTGTAVPHISGGQIKAFEFALPAMDTQVAIAAVLSALDDKIELNRRMNATLEASARALFRDWFVDFGPTRAKVEGRPAWLDPDLLSLFPDRLGDDGVPEGWASGTLGDIARGVNVKVEPSAIDPHTPYIGLEHMPRRSVALADWEGAGKVSSAKSRFKAGQVLFGKLRPYFHKVGLAPLDGICSTDIVVMEARQSRDAALLLACVSSDDFVAFANQGSTGTKMPRTSWSMMSRYPITRPATAIAERYQLIAGPLLEQITANIHESRTLAATRDVLLPKLMSGELRVRDAEALAA